MTYDKTTSRSRAIDYSRLGIVITDPSQDDNPIVDVNPAFEVMTGYTKQEIIGQNCRFLQGENSDQVALHEIKRAIQDLQHVRVEIQNYRKDGSMFWNELTVSPVFDDDNKLINFVGYQQDITDRLIISKELSSSNQELMDYNEILKLQALQQRTIDERINDLLKQAGYGRGH